MVRRTKGELAGDITLAGILLIAGLATTPLLVVWQAGGRPVDAGALVLVAIAAIAAGMRWWPLVSLGVTAAVTSAYLILGYPFGVILLTVAAATYTVARRCPLPRAAIATGGALVLLLLHVVVDMPVGPDGLIGLLPGVAWIVVPFSIGVARRLTVEASTRIRADAERRVLDDERLRLASEVHDIVGHGLAAIQMQADIALHVRDRKPEQAHQALEAISRVSAEALAELRTTLAAITPEDAPGRHESRAPTPGLDRVADLCARMRESGVEVSLAVFGRRRPVAAAVDVAAYRVVQESLTNVAKHASERRAGVRVTYGPDAVEVEIASPVAVGELIDEGFGIAGMRRRVRGVDGRFTIDAADGEFRVAATFPVVAEP